MSVTVEGAVRSGDRTRSRAELLGRAARAATGLLESGAHPGGAIAILMRNDIPFLEATFAASFIGAQAVPINWHFKAGEIGYLLEDSAATHLVVHADLLRELGEALVGGPEIVCVETPAEMCAAYGLDPEQAQAPAGVCEWERFLAAHEPLPRGHQRSGGTMMYTSGTTGRPKGVRREPIDPARRDVDARLRQLWFGNRPGLRTPILGPIYHSVQLSYTTAALQAPGEVILVPRFDPESVLALIAAERITHVHLVPIMISRLVRLPVALRESYDTSSLEFVVHGSAPCPADVKRELIDWLGPIVHEYYGTTETGMISRASSEEWLARPGTVGRAWPGRELRIYGEDGEPVPPGVAGEVCASLGAMPNFTYHNDQRARVEIERDGLVTSGDVGYLDEDGYLYLCDRKRDMLISGGVNVYPVEIEGVLAGHPAVLDAAVFGVPDPEYGEAVMAVVQLRDGAHVEPAELRDFTRRRLASFKVPASIEVCELLPRDESGKLAKRRLRDRYWEGAGRRI